jgi:hypothetical protein
MDQTRPGPLGLSGVKAGCFHPRDGHLYVVGLNGWQTAATRDGCLQRVRYTGRPVVMPLNVEAFAGSLRLTFSQPLDPKRAADVGNYHIERWNYLWSGEYGSKRYVPDRPGVVGQEVVPVTAARLADDRTVVLTVPALKPVMQMELSFKLTTAAGEVLRRRVSHDQSVASDKSDEVTDKPEAQARDESLVPRLRFGLVGLERSALLRLEMLDHRF